MIINKDKTIREIKDEFNSLYPGLKIEFYKKPHAAYRGTEKAEQYDEDCTISDMNPLFIPSDIAIKKDQTAENLEQEFEHMYGLHVQIFRRSNDLWLQTSMTDNWTLEVQNRKGINSVKQYK